MSSIDEISQELESIGASIREICSKIEREREEIISSMNRTQAEFGGDPQGQSLVQALFTALNEAVYADDALYGLRSDMTQLVGRLRR